MWKSLNGVLVWLCEFAGDIEDMASSDEKSSEDRS